MNILNLYAGIGGNRELWNNEHEITAIEFNPEIANIYKTFFPDDNVIVADAHEYLLKHFSEFDFIWASPPCQSHSGCNNFLHAQGIIRYPDMSLYQEILFLKHFFKGKFVVENVVPYYEPLVKAQKLGRHLFWSNFYIEPINIDYHQIGSMKVKGEARRNATIRSAQVPELTDLHGLKDFKCKNKRQVLRNCVLPELGKHIFDCMIKSEIIQGELFD